MSVLGLVRPELRELAAYRAAEQVGDAIRLNANESPYARKNERGGRPLNRYPEVRPAGLTALLAGHYGCEPEQLLVTRGSSEAIDLVMRVFCRAGIDKVLVAPPTFSMYEHYAIVQGVSVIEVPLDPAADFRFDAGRVIAACDDATKLVLVCSPNNPTGLSAGLDDIRAVAEARRNRSVVVVDEAYVEFAATSSALELLDDHDNVVVLRTLSKALGLAGARCGALITGRRLLRQFDAVQAPYSMPTPVVESVLGQLTDAALAECRRNIRAIIDERERLAGQLVSLPDVTRVCPSDANFLLVQFVNTDAVTRACRSAGILVRKLDGPLGEYVRITIGTPAENERLLAVLAARKEACA